MPVDTLAVLCFEGDGIAQTWHLSRFKQRSILLAVDDVHIHGRSGLLEPKCRYGADSLNFWSAGAAILPETSALRRAVHSRIIGSGSGKTVVFATGGERGALKLWRGDTGQCIYEQGCA